MTGADAADATPKDAVFLSYASEDAPAARRIADSLKAGGIEVWLDQSELRSGEAWDQSIRARIRDCALFVPVISATTRARLEGYFRREWRLAVDRTLDMAEGMPFIVPVIIDGTSAESVDVPEPFRRVQWTPLPGGDTPGSFTARIRELLAPAAVHAGRSPSDRVLTGTAASAKSSRRFVLALLIIAVTVTTLGVFIIAGLALTSHPHGSGSQRLWTSVRALPLAGIEERRHGSPRTLNLPD